MSKSISELQEMARRIRVETIKSLHIAQSGHPGSSLSIVDVLTALYFGGILRHDPANPAWEGRDYFLLSNGHAVPGLYACLALAGYYPVEKLDGLRQLGTLLEGHAKRGTFPGIEISSGSLGQGLPVSVGIALGLKLQKKNNRVFVMMSDGEQQEGSTWEAIMFAPKHRLNNLIAIIDKNGNQINGPTHIIMPSLDPLAAKYQAFHWETAEIDGNDMFQILAAFSQAIAATGPFAIISHSVTGKGVSFMEGDYHWHHGLITDELFLKAMGDLCEPVSQHTDETWLPGYNRLKSG
ncbi:MAG: transketolase [Anaerolineae bacterium]|nr:transketolase [Anaerolineae bacterium]